MAGVIGLIPSDVQPRDPMAEGPVLADPPLPGAFPGLHNDAANHQTRYLRQLHGAKDAGFVVSLE
jgi:hypothetical protein